MTERGLQPYYIYSIWTASVPLLYGTTFFSRDGSNNCDGCIFRDKRNLSKQVKGSCRNSCLCTCRPIFAFLSSSFIVTLVMLDSFLIINVCTFILQVSTICKRIKGYECRNNVEVLREGRSCLIVHYISYYYKEAHLSIFPICTNI